MKSFSFLLVLCALSLQPAYCLAYPETVPVYETTWGGLGTGPGEFGPGIYLAVNSLGQIYASDSWNHRVQVFDNSGNFITTWGDSGCADGDMIYPLAIAIDALDNVYVASMAGSPVAQDDSCTARIQKFTVAGVFVDRWAEFGYGPGEISFPVGMTVDNVGYIYVTEFTGNRVQKFAPDGTSVLTWNGTESSIPAFRNPVGINVTPDGNLVVTDWGPGSGQRVLLFTDTGALVQTYAQGHGTGDGQFIQPSGVAVDGSGNIYVVDRGNHRVQKFAPDGTLLVVWGTMGNGPGEFYDPWDIAVDGLGNIFVSDGDGRIHKFRVPTALSVPDRGVTARPTAFPNPFAHSTTAIWPGAVSPSVAAPQVMVIDVTGRLLRVLTSRADGDAVVVTWDGRDATGRDVGSGIYFLRMEGATGWPASRVVRQP